MPPRSGLRPILMTTAAMVVAMVPLLIAKGAGAASRFDIGVVIAAGMTIGTLFTLFVTPAVYTYHRQGPSEGQGRRPRRLSPDAAAAGARRGWAPETVAEADSAAGGRHAVPRARGAGAGGGPIIAGGACLQLGRCRRFEPRPRAQARPPQGARPKLPTAAE